MCRKIASLILALMLMPCMTAASACAAAGKNAANSGAALSETGQDPTVLYIMIGVMVVAVAVIIILHIKNRNH